MSDISDEIGQTVRLALRSALPTAPQSWEATARLILIGLVGYDGLFFAVRHTRPTTRATPSAVHDDLPTATAHELGEHSDHGPNARPPH